MADAVIAGARVRRPISPTVAGLKQWAEDHDDLCAGRYDELRTEIRDLKRGAWGIVIAIAAWSLSQLWISHQTHEAAAPSAAPAAAIAQLQGK